MAEILSQLDIIEMMLKEIKAHIPRDFLALERRRRPKNPDGNYAESCATCISWTKNTLNFQSDPDGQCDLLPGFATAIPTQQQVKVKDKDGKDQIGIQQGWLNMTAWPHSMLSSQWCQQYFRDPMAKPDLLSKLAQDVQKKAGQNSDGGPHEPPKEAA